GLLEANLQVLKLDGNPFRSIRRAILEGGTKAILKYLKDKIVDYCVSLHEGALAGFVCIISGLMNWERTEMVCFDLFQFSNWLWRA
ncbi:Hypothetical predicted protein, partial [Olea europaea subsp. europaea]